MVGGNIKVNCANHCFLQCRELTADNMIQVKKATQNMYRTNQKEACLHTILLWGATVCYKA